MTDLHSYFDTVAAKRLSEVEANPHASNQHELNGVAELRPILGTEARRRELSALHFDMDQIGWKEPSLVSLTWYDARFDHPTRTEWRLYYGAELQPSLKPDGTLVLARRANELFLFTARPGGSGERVLSRLFKLDGLSSRFDRLGDRQLDDSVAAAEQLVLAQLGIVSDTDESLTEHFFDTFGSTFPRGELLSQFVRDNTFGIDPLVDPDEALVTWARVELELFNAMETLVEAEAMELAETLDEKLHVAMRVFQRRKSRAGKAFEYHLRGVFDLHGLNYTPNPVTEGSERPDFIFPGITEYHDPDWPAEKLVMLGAKQTLRDRWRQILHEADRIPQKHLATLDVDLSANQILEIEASGIQLVLPKPLHDGYPTSSQERLWGVATFIEWVQSR